MPDPPAHPGELTRPTSSVKGKWTYLYRAVDKQGRTVDFLLSKKRDTAVAKRFFIKAIRNNDAPAKITLDGYEATHQAVTELKAEAALASPVEVRTSKYLNNLIEQDHRRVKQRYYPMLGSKNFNNAAVTLGGTPVGTEDQERAVRHIKHQPRGGRGATGLGSCVRGVMCRLETTSALAVLLT